MHKTYKAECGRVVFPVKGDSERNMFRKWTTQSDNNQWSQKHNQNIHLNAPRHKTTLTMIKPRVCSSEKFTIGSRLWCLCQIVVLQCVSTVTNLWGFSDLFFFVYHSRWPGRGVQSLPLPALCSVRNQQGTAGYPAIAAGSSQNKPHKTSN